MIAAPESASRVGTDRHEPICFRSNHAVAFSDTVFKRCAIEHCSFTGGTALEFVFETRNLTADKPGPPVARRHGYRSFPAYAQCDASRSRAQRPKCLPRP